MTFLTRKKIYGKARRYQKIVELPHQTIVCDSTIELSDLHV